MAGARARAGHGERPKLRVGAMAARRVGAKQRAPRRTPAGMLGRSTQARTPLRCFKLLRLRYERVVVDSTAVEDVQCFRDQALAVGRVEARDALEAHRALLVDPHVDAHKVRACSHLDAAAPALPRHSRRVRLQREARVPLDPQRDRRVGDAQLGVADDPIGEEQPQATRARHVVESELQAVAKRMVEAGAVSRLTHDAPSPKQQRPRVRAELEAD
mmetsp:Transcript_3713/g.8406  ORF Transcript_3713/g.8406 Transcript_3713/m.8406 type:complete len:216 (+) Transcript_3713:689-1336(+)